MNGPDPVYARELSLCYYKKGNEIWGEPLIVGTKETEINKDKLVIYPNPATTFITIQIKEGIAIEEAIIYNHLGQKALVAVPVNNTVDVSELTPGIYFLEVITSDSRAGTKLVVE
jgi:hypothetical protein